MLFRHDELVDVLLAFCLVLLERAGDAVRDTGGPGVGLLPLDTKEGVRVEIPHADWESFGKLLSWKELRVQKIFSISIHFFAVLGRFTRNSI